MAKAKKSKKSSKEEPMITIGYKGLTEEGKEKDSTKVPVRHFLGLVWKHGDENEVPAKFKNTIDDDMKALGFYVK